MLKKSAWIGGTLAFVILLIVIAPAALIQQFESIPHVSLESTQGTIWHGNADTFLEQQHIGILGWRVRTSDMIKGKLTVDLTLERDGVSLVGVSTSQFDTQEISINGEIGSRFVNIFALAYDISLSGDLMFNDVIVRVNHENQIESVEGNLTWNGGPVRFKLANVMHEVDLEPVLGTLSQGADFVELNVTRTQTTARILAFRFEPETGWVHLRAYPAFLEFANVPPNYLMQDADFLFEVSQKLL